MGLAAAQLLASRGALLSLADLNTNSLHAAISSLPNSHRHLGTVVDVRNAHDVDTWISSTVERFGRLDGAVNMAGVITPACPIAEMTDQKWDFEMGVNATGIFNSLRAQVRAMAADGCIVSDMPPK